MRNQLGIPAVIAAIIIACVVGGVVGTRNNDDDNTDARNAAQPSPSDAASSKLSEGVLTSGMSDDHVPQYSSGVSGTASVVRSNSNYRTDQHKVISSSYCYH